MDANFIKRIRETALEIEHIKNHVDNKKSLPQTAEIKLDMRTVKKAQVIFNERKGSILLLC